MFDPAVMLPLFSHAEHTIEGEGPYLQVARRDPNRVYLCITNMSGDTVYLWPNPPTDPFTGHLALADRESREWKYSDHGIYTAAFWWVSSPLPTMKIYTMGMCFYPPKGVPWVAG